MSYIFRDGAINCPACNSSNFLKIKYIHTKDNEKEKEVIIGFICVECKIKQEENSASYNVIPEF